MTQYFFVDESGDPGLSNLAVSPYYIVSMNGRLIARQLNKTPAAISSLA